MHTHQEADPHPVPGVAPLGMEHIGCQYVILLSLCSVCVGLTVWNNLCKGRQTGIDGMLCSHADGPTSCPSVDKYRVSVDDYRS